MLLVEEESAVLLEKPLILLLPVFDEEAVFALAWLLADDETALVSWCQYGKLTTP